MKYLEEKEIGFKVGDITVPIVCGASLFDLAVGDSKIRPDKEMGYLASQNSEKILSVKEILEQEQELLLENTEEWKEL